MGRVVILEGPDGGGKTTLAKQLVELGFKYRHEGPPTDTDLVAHYLDSLYESIIGTQDVVHDRLYLGETIYGPIARGKSLLGDKGLKLFERIERSRTVHQYICLPKYDIALGNYKKKIQQRDDYLNSLEKWKLVYNAYLAYVSGGNTSGLYDYSTDSVERILEGLTVSFSLPIGAIGRRQAKYLFIGDKANHEYIDIPFFSLKGSSGYFNTALELANIEEKDLCVYNANNCYGIRHDSLKELLGNLTKLEHIFVMGAEARHFIADQIDDQIDDLTMSVKIHVLEHPSYLKRFRGNNPQIMADKIKERLNGTSH